MEACADVFQAFLDFSFKAAWGGEVVAFFDAEVILRGNGIGKFVGVAVVVSDPLFFSALVVGVLEVFGDGEEVSVTDVATCGEDSFGGGVGFRGAGEVGNGLGEVELAFGQPDHFAGLGGSDGEGEGVGVGISDIFAGQDDESSGEEADFFPAFEHFGEPVEGGVGVASADAFDQGADDIVVGIAVAVVSGDTFLDGLGRQFAGEVDGVFKGGEDADFEGGEGASGVAVAGAGEVFEGVVVGLDVPGSQTTFGVVDGTAKEGEDIFLGEGVKLKEAASAQEGVIDGEEGVFGRGADQDDDPIFDVGEEDVLLGFVEAVDFVHEKEGAASFGGQVVGSFGEDFAKLLDPLRDGADLDEVAMGFDGEQAGEGGFSGTWGAVKEHGAEPVGSQQATEHFSGSEEVLLSDELGEGAGAHAGREGACAFPIRFFHGIKEGHGFGLDEGLKGGDGASREVGKHRRETSYFFSNRREWVPAFKERRV